MTYTADGLVTGNRTIRRCRHVMMSKLYHLLTIHIPLKIEIYYMSLPDDDPNPLPSIS